MEARISNGNSKLGNIPNVSLVPIKDCKNCEACKRSCYALKAWRQYPLTRDAWKHNSRQVKKRGPGRSEWFESINQYIAKRKPKYFRWHVAGDIKDQHYFHCMAHMAKLHPDTNFLCFTKRFDLDFSKKPKNLAILLSMYPTMKAPRKKLPRAWMQDGTENRIPRNAVECSGHCSECHACWDLKGRDVFFHKH